MRVQRGHPLAIYEPRRGMTEVHWLLACRACGAHVSLRARARKRTEDATEQATAWHAFIASDYTDLDLSCHGEDTDIKESIAKHTFDGLTDTEYPQNAQFFDSLLQSLLLPNPDFTTTMAYVL
eukprot:6155157-Amphidinium_carterae.1